MNGAERAGSDGASASGGVQRVALGALGGLLLAIVLWGGYSHHWPWTGINGASATLWDWLHLLLLPLAFAILPIWFRRDTRVHPNTKAAAAAVLTLLGIVVVLGYTVPWAWTGFRGNTLWDWINLVLLPLSLLAIPRLLELREGWGTRHSVVAFTAAAAFGALVLGGYLGTWGWTGFTGNTLWDWLNLLFLPLLVPTVLLPTLTPIATGRVIYLDADGNPIPAPVTIGEPSPAGTDGEPSPAPVEADASALDGEDADPHAVAPG